MRMKNGVFSEYKIFAGNSNPELAEEIAAIMGKPLGKSTVSKFSDGEISVSLWESVRGEDVYIIQSTCNPTNDNLMELLIMVDAMKSVRFQNQCGDFLITATPDRTEKRSQRPYYSEADGRSSQCRRRRPGYHDGSACGSDSGVL